MTAAQIVCEVKICEPGGKGNFLPALSGEADWPKALRAILYFLGLMWSFMGVAIVADVFMGAIERITSTKKRKMVAGRPTTIKVWNDTVANLTLMALGSSAPEILLSVIELVAGKMYSGDLGPATIVGSAAFNLLVISAVCVVAIPGGQTRYVKDMHVFIVTASFSIFAYMWLYLIVGVFTEDVIQWWESVLTFLMFPGLVGLAWYADRGGFSSSDVRDEVLHTKRLSLEGISKEELAEFEAQIRRRHPGEDLDEETIARLIEQENMKPKSRAAYRVEATRKFVGSKRVITSAAQQATSLSAVVPFTEAPDLKSDDITIEFNAESYAVVESIGTLNIPVKRSGCLEQAAQVDYCSRDGSAKANEDYEPCSGTLKFLSGEDEKEITIKIIDDTENEDDEDFFIDLVKARCPDANYSCVIGRIETTRIAIIDDEKPGVLSFEKEELQTPEDIEREKTVNVVVKRENGCDGKISCKFKTEEHTATAGKDFVSNEGVLEMENGQTSATIDCVILPRGRYDTSEEFRLIIFEATGGAKFDAETDGGADSCICTIAIKADEKERGRVDRIMNVLQMDWDKAQIGHANWLDQFKDAVMVNGGDADMEPTVMDWIMHVLTVFWKLLFAVIPPTDFYGGWACFICALIMIGFVTAIIGDLASLLGCVLSIPGSITAITFVALGTSLPDTFASKTAAVQDPYADASIGNITGSNSVNVFLGLGLPWMIGSFYWRMQDLDSEKGREWAKKYPDVASRLDGNVRFVVKGGDLGFSVVIFSICAIACLATLVARRQILKGELGGPDIPKIGTAVFFVGLWFIYIGLSVWKILDSRGPCD